MRSMCAMTMSPTCTLPPGSTITTPSSVTMNAGLFMNPWFDGDGSSVGPWIT